MKFFETFNLRLLLELQYPTTHPLVASVDPGPKVGNVSVVETMDTVVNSRIETVNWAKDVLTRPLKDKCGRAHS